MRNGLVGLCAIAIAAAAGCGGNEQTLEYGTAQQASHSWNGYHWARTTNSFTLSLGDNVSGAWDSVLGTTSSDWSKSTVLDTRIVSGRTTAKRCRATAGRVEVCNSTYGRTGWLGIAQVWANGTHITQGTVKLNDTYFNTSTYNTTAWRNLVSCQEVGHTLGLDHQDTNFDNPPLGTCMDYTNDPTPNQHPDTHDYDELKIIYGHVDSTTTVGQIVAAGASFDHPSTWGALIASSRGGRSETYERALGGEARLLTFVTWADNE